VGSSEGVARTLYLLCNWIVSVRAVDECTFLRLEELTFCQPFLGGERPSSSSLYDDILCICEVMGNVCGALALPEVHDWFCIGRTSVSV
jgi:hypothetical protein